MSIRAGRVACVAGACTLALAACSSVSGTAGSTAGPTTPVHRDKTFTWGFESEFSSYNLNTPAGGTSGNMVVLNPVLNGFYQFQPDGSIKPNADFGTYAKIGDDPLTVKYSINPKAVWSDGVPIDCDDFALAWLANSGVTGKKGFSAGAEPGFADQNKPQCKSGDRDITLTYRRPYADWATLYGPTTLMPAHIVEREARLSKTFVDLADTPRSPELVAAAEFYDKEWNFAPGQLKQGIMPSSGPYRIDSWSAGQSLTLKANPRWWGAKPKMDRIVIRYISGDGQAQALANGEIQAMDPSPQVDIVKQLKALGNKIKMSTHDALKYEHLDFNFAGPFKDRSLREAFAKCLPRQLIVDDLIKPQNPQAEIMQSRFVYPFQPGYEQVAAADDGRRYDLVDIAGARTLLAGRTPTLRIGWAKSPTQVNNRRARTIELIRSSCRQAGFTVVDAGAPTFYEQGIFGTGYDVAMFSWSQSGMVAGLADQFVTTGSNNPYHYSNRQVDTLFDQLSTQLDHDRQLPLLQQLDTVLWNDLATIPLYALPALLATAPNVQGVQFNGTSVDLTWNAASWDLS